MALTSKKYTALHNKTGSDKVKLKEKFDEGHISNISDYPDDDPLLTAIVYQIGLMQEELDYLRTEIGSNKNKTGISDSQSDAIVANTAKSSFTTSSAVSGTTASIVSMVHESKGASNFLTITVALTTAKGTSNKRVTLTLT
tara:strand:- start:98 stop:520 length:423 start_codon:yes stop_codon:yes gene_type:complete